jgi:hypothetical protein
MQQERALLILFSYIIGFVTAYIAFGLSLAALPPAKPAVIMPAAPEQTATVLAETATMTEYVEEVAGTRVSTEPLGLFVEVAEARQIVSGQLQQNQPPQRGFHAGLQALGTSPDGQFVAYCSTPTAEATECDAYVYSVADTVVYPVRNADTGTPVRVPVGAAQLYWSEVTLIVGDHRSEEGSQPWLVARAR